MILALLTAAKRALLCRLGWHDWTRPIVRSATYHYREGGRWVDSGVREGGWLGSRVCRVAACQRHELEVRQQVWVEASSVTAASAAG